MRYTGNLGKYATDFLSWGASTNIWIVLMKKA